MNTNKNISGSVTTIIIPFDLSIEVRKWGLERGITSLKEATVLALETIIGNGKKNNLKEHTANAVEV